MLKKFAVLFLLVWVFPLAAHASSIFSTNSVWRYTKGLAEASSPDPNAWRNPGFDDSAWTLARAPFYYDSDTSASGYTGNTVLNDMRGGYTCIFLRQDFVVTNLADFAQLQLSALSDDGFIAWINGVEVARFNMPDGFVAYNGSSLAALPEPVPFQVDTLTNLADFLVQGTNIISVQAFNSSISGSSDFVIFTALDYTTDTTVPVVSALYPPAATTVTALTSIEVDFSKAVAGVDAADLLINGSPATNVTSFSPSQYLFDFPPTPNGAVTVAWTANHGIKDLATIPNAFGGGNWSYLVDPNLPVPGVTISEFMADNKKTLHDEDGDSSDCIELFNSSTNVVNLANWSLTTDPEKPTEWRFPPYTLAARSYLVVFASGKNRTNATGTLHTNFKLPASGSYLALVNPALQIVSAFAPAYPAQTTDVSFGRDQASPEVLGYFTVPTPGAANSQSGAAFAPEVQFTRPGGNFVGQFTLELYTSATNAVIHYTLNGTAPTEVSPTYTVPLTYLATLQIRARAFVPGLLPGPTHSETYVQLNANLVNTSSDLPAVVIYNFAGGAVPVNNSQFANFSIYEPQSGRTFLTNSPTLSVRGGLHVRGSSTQGLPKQSWAVEFWDEFNDAANHSPLGLPTESDWVLYAPNLFDNVMLHNPFIYQLSNEIGRYAPRTRYVEVYLNTAGGPLTAANYNGIYVLEEKIKIGPDRVNIDKLQPENNTAPSVTGGYLMKIDRTGPGETGLGAAGQLIVYTTPSEADIKTPQRAPQQLYLQNYLNAFGSALNGATYQDPINGFRAYVDVNSWIDHHILNVTSFNVDALRLSAYFYKPRNAPMVFGPIWDFDRSQGSTDGRDFNPRLWRSTSGDTGTDFFNYPWWGRMFTDPDFWQLWIDRYQDLRAGMLSTSHVFTNIDTFAGQVRLQQPRETARWPSMTTPRSGTVTSGSYRYTFPGSYQGEVNFMKQWYTDRLNFMDTNFLARPVFNVNGGPITPGFSLSVSEAATATLYYTTNGVDPRLPGGGLSPAARIYSSPIVLNTNSRVVVRAYNAAHHNLTGPDNPPLSSPWSGAMAATFITATPALVITEIMYHPAPPPAGNTNSAENFEYLELKNVGATTLNLLGMSFTNGISYLFTPNSSLTNLAAGKTVLLVRNRAAFSSRYPGVTNVAGEYSGTLDNAGERLALVGAMLEPMLDFSYDNQWYPITDGFGFSLVAVNENAPGINWGISSSWRPSANFNGSPGTNDPAATVFPVVLINEALTHTDLPQLDAVELFNAGSTPANIGNWFLTDDFQHPQKYRFSNGTTIPAGGYLIIDENSFNNGSSNSFRLSSLGEEVYLFSGNTASNLTGYYHGFSFGAAQHGVSFGRHVISTGAEKFVAQLSNTLGAANSGPRVGPFVISEIMYDPAPVSGTNNNTLDESIEIRNITPGVQPLFDPNYATNTWKLAGGVDFVFPTGVSLPPGGYLLVVGFDPAHQPAQLASFRSRFGVNTNVLVLGPWSGTLNNQGERLQLLRPDQPQPPGDPNAGLVPYVLVDQVSYSNLSPWPTNANASGLSLQRIASAAFGDDPANWRTAAPTMGRDTVGSAPLDYDGDGLPDAWELANGLDPMDATGLNGASGDPDGDGVSNLQEYLSGTNPQDPTSYLRVDAIQAIGGTAKISFTAQAGRTYTILYRTAAGNGSWLKLSDIAAQPATTMMTLTDASIGAGTTRFYRLVTPQVP